jgi:hypothetical protein
MQAGSEQSPRERPSGNRESLKEEFSPNRAPVAGKREVDLYVRTYITLLQSSGAVSVASLEPAHLTAASSLHAGAEEPEPDFSAFLYSAQRIPQCIAFVQHIILGQTLRSFVREGFAAIDSWQAVSAPGRRRRWYWDGEELLAAYIASASDLDDLIPSIVAYQFEWNKMNRLLESQPEVRALISLASRGTPSDDEDTEIIRESLLLQPSDWNRLITVWGDSFWSLLNLVATGKKKIDFRMLGGTFLGYGRSTRTWWRPVISKLAELQVRDRPIYFVSSNTHSIANTLSGVATRRRDELTAFIEETQHPELLPELRKLHVGETLSSWENLLYFAARPYFHGPAKEEARRVRQGEEEELGIFHLEPEGALDVGVQIIDLSRLDSSVFDSRLNGFKPSASDALIVNINYPLGMAAYHIMSQIGVSSDQLQGIYILGKAATLNARIGDIMMSNVVYDEHSGNTYWFDNCFGYDSVAPYLRYGAALDNQKAVTVKGTFLQNQGYLDFYYRENFTVVEMEAGPYLSAIYEDLFLERHPKDEAVYLHKSESSPDLGIIHYASDTPYTRAHTLGARGLSFYGMDSTYASTIAILRRIFDLEGSRKERVYE